MALLKVGWVVQNNIYLPCVQYTGMAKGLSEDQAGHRVKTDC